jgi:hypothetical protein
VSSSPTAARGSILHRRQKVNSTGLDTGVLLRIVCAADVPEATAAAAAMAAAGTGGVVAGTVRCAALMLAIGV